MSNAQTMQYLVERLNYYRDQYYNHAVSVVSDQEYDATYDMLQQLEEETGIVLANSPTRTVGYLPASDFQKIVHQYPMLSMAKTKTVSEVEAFCKGREVMISPKYDGLSLAAVYEDGHLVRLETRGDGTTGYDVTCNASLIVNLPTTIPFDAPVTVLGECLMRYKSFEEANATLAADEEPYKTPRNLAAGTLRLKDISGVRNRKLEFFAWDIVGVNIGNRTNDEKFYTSCGFDHLPSFTDGGITNYVIPDYQNKIDLILKLAADEDIPVDGVVFKYTDRILCESLGATSHHPNWALAFKPKQESELTTLRNIEWSVGRTGVLTPVAVFDTVVLDGTEVSRANVHNPSIINALQLGIGDTVEVEKANQIIPQIISNETKSGGIKLPDACPECGGKTVLVEDELHCSNPLCGGVLRERLAYFCSRKCMDIGGLSTETIQKLIDAHLLNGLAGIYELPRFKEKIASLDGMGKRSCEKLLESIENSRNNAKLDHFIAALGIPGIGYSAAKTLAKKAKTAVGFRKLVEDCFNFSTLTDFGEVMNANIYAYFADITNDLEYETLSSAIQFADTEDASTKYDGYFFGKTVVVTGTFASMKRDVIIATLEQAGATVTKSVSKKTDILIVGEKPGSKLEMAQKYGITTINEEYLTNLVQNNWQ